MMYTVYVGSSLISLSSWFATLMKGLGASSRIFEILDAKPVKSNYPPHSLFLIIVLIRTMNQ